CAHAHAWARALRRPGELRASSEGRADRPRGAPCPALMAFAPMGPEASFFEVLDQHRASLLATLRRDGGGPVGGDTHQASRYVSSEGMAAAGSAPEVPWGPQPLCRCGGRRAAPLMISHCTVRKIRSDSPKSVKKFALILKILSMIYKLVQSNTYATKRDIYYMDSQLFGNQTIVDNIINDISCMLKVPRRSLHILSTSKGLIAGNLRFVEEDGTKVNCPCGATVSNVPILNFTDLITDAKFLLIVEKDATFQRLLDDNFCSRTSPCIVVTGKGVPDLNTRLLVKKLWDTFRIPVFTLVDADPHGIEIMCIYKYGSVSMSFEAHHLTVPAIRWLGLLPSDIKRLNISKDTLIPLTKRDQMKLDSILKRPYVTCQPLEQEPLCDCICFYSQMEIMADSKVKAEIQALTCLSSDYLS
ncbi:Meiotic recombination protein SPO11, partial [Galemys pyrenaicus]